MSFIAVLLLVKPAFAQIEQCGVRTAQVVNELSFVVFTITSPGSAKFVLEICVEKRPGEWRLIYSPRVFNSLYL